MNNSFSFYRLGLLIRKQWIENSRFYLLSLLAIAGGLFLILGAYSFVFSDGKTTSNGFLNFFFVFLYISGLIFASMVFSPLNDKAKGSFFLSLPASHLEKLIINILFGCIFFVGAYYLIFEIVQQSLIAIGNASMKGFSYTKSGTDLTDEHQYALIAFFILQAVYLLGSVYFTKYQFIFTTLITSVLLILFVLTMVFMQKKWFEPTGYSLNFFKAVKYHPDFGAWESVEVSSLAKNIVTNAFKYALIPLLWFITWLRLREKQI